MKKLNYKQIEIICTYVLQANLDDEALQNELIDHICCEVEVHLEGGKDFESALQLVLEEANLAQLQKIHQESVKLIQQGKEIERAIKIAQRGALLCGLGSMMILLKVPGEGWVKGIGIFITHAGGNILSFAMVKYLLDLYWAWKNKKRFNKYLRLRP